MKYYPIAAVDGGLGNKFWDLKYRKGVTSLIVVNKMNR